MARETGDLWPQASGSASLGVEMTNGMVTRSIRPFLQIHQVSGIFVDALLGQSGVIRFNLEKRAFQASIDGGSSFRSIVTSESTLGFNDLSLQDAYYGGTVIQTDSRGPTQLRGGSVWALSINAFEKNFPHILMSGIASNSFAGGTQRGAFWLQGHTGGVVNQSRGTVEDYDEARARSLGIDTFFLQTVSGVVGVRSTSGVSQFYNSTASSSIDATGRLANLNTQVNTDRHFAVNASSGITFFVPGLYLITYSAVLEKNNGNLAQQVNTELRVYDRFGNGQKLAGSDSSAVLRDASTLNLNTSNGQWLGDILPGETVQLFASTSTTPYADNTVRFASRKCNVIVQWMGTLSSGGASRLALDIAP